MLTKSFPNFKQIWQLQSVKFANYYMYFTGYRIFRYENIPMLVSKTDTTYPLEIFTGKCKLRQF